MAKIIKNSILGRIKGSIGDVSIFNTKTSGQIIRRKGGPSQEQMLTNPNFKVTLQNQKEFGGCSTAGAALRKGFESPSKAFKNGDFSGPLAGKLRQIAQSGIGDIGKRDLYLVNAPQHLLNFDIRKDNLFDRTYQAPIKIHINSERTTIYVQIPKSDPDHHIKPPKHTTHFQLTFATSLLSTYRYNADLDKYQPTNPNQNAIGTVIESSPIDWRTTHNDLQLTIPIPNGIPLAHDVAATVWIGITYGQNKYGQYDDMAANRAMKCAAVL